MNESCSLEINGKSYRIESMNYGFTLIEKKQGVNKQNEEITYDSILGYYGNLQQLRAGLFQHGITGDITILNNLKRCEEMYEQLKTLGCDTGGKANEKQTNRPE